MREGPRTSLSNVVRSSSIIPLGWTSYPLEKIFFCQSIWMAPRLLVGTVGWAIDNGDLLVEVWGSRIGVELFEETMRCLVISVLKTEVC